MAQLRPSDLGQCHGWLQQLPLRLWPDWVWEDLLCARQGESEADDANPADLLSIYTIYIIYIIYIVVYESR